MRDEPKPINKTVNVELSVLTFDKMRDLLNKYREIYGLQTYDDLINFLIKNQPMVE